MAYETEEEKVAAIKDWWKSNGLSVFAGIALGLAAIFAWHTWSNHRIQVAAQASDLFEELVTAASQDDSKEMTSRDEKLHKDFSSTPYPEFADLIAARLLYENGQSDQAIERLQQVIDNPPDPAFASIAALRMARIQLAEGKPDEATQTLKKHDNSTAFAGEFAVVRGDIAVARGDATAARAAYEEALAKNASLSQLIHLKLDNLATAG